VARARAGLSAVLALAVPAAAWPAPGCDAERPQTGLGTAVRDGQVTVIAVGTGTPAERAGFREGDAVLQVNAVVPHTCAQWGRAVAEARGEEKALLVLVLRDGAEVPLALGAGTWAPPAEAAARTAAEGVAGLRTTTTTLPVRRPASPLPPPPPPLPPDAPISFEGVVVALERLAPPDQPPSDLRAYGEAVRQVRREIETLAARGAAPPEQLAALRRASRHYEAAQVAWEAIEGPRAEERRMRRMPVAENAPVPYFADSPVATIVDEFDFLGATVAREPTGGPLGLESSGAWRPVWARLLLWERGAREVAALRSGRGGTP